MSGGRPTPDRGGPASRPKSAPRRAPRPASDSTLEEATARIKAWGEAREWRGFDPYDGLNSPLAPILTLSSPLGRRMLTQLVKLSPINLRPILGIRPDLNAKAIALVASGYARLAAAAGSDLDRARAVSHLDWLVGSGATPSGTAWGYHFDVQTRFFFYPRGRPNTIATAYAAHALMDGVELLGDDRWAETVAEAARFLQGSMLVDRGGTRVFFRYVEGDDQLIHNANALACGVLVRAASLLGDDSLRATAQRALEATLSAQSADGSWRYADERGSWVDNFHTGYVLESLARCRSLGGGVQIALERGLEYWEQNLFLSDGTPKYRADRVFPIDSHCYAQAIETRLAVADQRPDARERATRAAVQLIDRMLDREGYVHFQRRRLWSSKVPFIRWSTAPAFRALAGLVLHESRSPRLVKEAILAGLD